MFNFPFFGYPYNYPYYRYYNKYNNNIKDTSNTLQLKNQEKKENDSITNSQKISSTINYKSYSNSDQAIFEIFGIKLYLDDLIIIGLLFFLYQQNVNDELLYIILILLLFS